MSLIKEFKEFISRGNVIDLAVGVVIGGAFTSIVTSLTKDILTPCISFITGKVDISKLQFVVNENLTIPYGLFLQSIINFLITAIAVFAIIKVINSVRTSIEKMHKVEEEVAEEIVEEISAEEKLLTEIRDLLKEKN